jgi:hypothetical protein
MPLLRRKSRPQPGLLTGVISAENDQWTVSWTSDGGKEPPGFSAPNLTDAAQQATAAAVAAHAEDRRAPGDELQFAIFPWDYGKNAPMYDIGGTFGQFTAHDIQGSEREITAGSLEELVVALSREPSGDEAMLRWVRRFDELPGGTLTG